jgi:origin recognition complex subunit 2
MMNADDDNDIRQAAYLRYRFTETDFFSIWRYLQEAGWKWKGGCYQPPSIVANDSSLLAPSPETSYDAKQVQELLDLSAVPRLDNYLQQQPSLHAPGESRALLQAQISQLSVEKCHELRMKVIDNMPISLLRDSMTLGNNKHRTADEYKTENLERTSRRRPRRSTTTSLSATIVDQGANLLINKSRNSNTNKSKKRKSDVSTADDSSLLSTLDFPTPQQVIHDLEQQLRSSSHNRNLFTSDYAEWLFLLSTRHSLLLYGYGSKRNLLNDFAQTTLEPVGDVIVIDAFDKHASLENVLDLLVQVCLDKNEPGEEDHDLSNVQLKRLGIYPVATTGSALLGTPPEVLRAVRVSRAVGQVQQHRKRPLYLVIHNLEGFSHKTQQEALAALLIHSSVATKTKDARTIRLVASVDHVNASTLLWDPLTTCNLAFIWKLVTTNEHYVEELKRGSLSSFIRTGSLGKRNKRIVNAQSNNQETVAHVLTTLAPRHAEVLQLLASMQATTKAPVNYRDFLETCSAKYMVVSDQQLRLLMTELTDHGLVERLVTNGRGMVHIPDSDKVQEILNYDGTGG